MLVVERPGFRRRSLDYAPSLGASVLPPVCGLVVSQGVRNLREIVESQFWLHRRPYQRCRAPPAPS